jgi:hypothetical protein
MTTFEVGGLYFWLQYADGEDLFLVPESVVFLGTNLEPTGTEDIWYFQDAKSYCVYGPETFSEAFDKEVSREEFAKVASESVPTTLVTLHRRDLCQVVDCEGLVKAASECAIRRSKAGKSA